MWEWLDAVDMGEDVTPFTTDPSFGDLTGGVFDTSAGSLMPGAIPEADPTFGGTLTDVGNGSFEDISGADLAATDLSSAFWEKLTTVASKLGVPAADLARTLIGGGAGRAAGGGTAPGGGIGLGEAAFDSTPFLLSAALANQQRNDINPYIDRLNSLNDQFAGNQSPYIKSLTDPYDMATASQKGQLTMGLGNRGVLGSSFGNMDLDNFNYMRDLGRGNLVAQGITQSAGAQSQMTDQAMKAINTRNAGTNALLGEGLNASGRMFNRPTVPQPKRIGELPGTPALFAPNYDPFGLGNLGVNTDFPVNPTW